MSMMVATEIKLDHVTVAGTDLKRMRENLAAVGIPSEYGGAHANGATEMALTSFPDGSYLELIGILPGADTKALNAHSWCNFMKQDVGPCAFASRVDDLKAEIVRLKANGVEVSPPQRSGRTRPDGKRLEWEVADVAVGPWGVFFPLVGVVLGDPPHAQPLVPRVIAHTKSIRII